MNRDIYRPLRMVHDDFGYLKDDSLETKCRCIRERIAGLKARGFGGIVTNVAHQDYLQDPVEFALMEEKVHACRELGMRMWLYDEDGWPSGAAIDLTVSADPECQARACAMVLRILKPGEKMELPLPRGHLKLLGAVCYLMAGERPTDAELLAPRARCNSLPVSFHNDTDQNLLCLSFFERYALEETQAMNNGYACRRYIDVSDPEAVRLFIENTYRPYTARLRKYYADYVGDAREDAVIEAIFTDEPSFMGVYINHNEDGIHGYLIHEPDPDMPLYPIVNWGRHVANRFFGTYGYRLEDELTALFLGHGEHFRQVREDFYSLMSTMYEEAFFVQLSNYCASVGLNFSGHLLLEDEISMHAMYEGNYFRLMRHMHIPGFDILNGVPARVFEQAFTPLLLRSVAELYGNKPVMDETGSQVQGGKVSPEQMYCSLMMQLALGADVFHSYYPETDDEAKKKVWDALTRANRAISGKRESETLLYYPIETVMQYRKPYQTGIENDHGNYCGFRELDDVSDEKVCRCQQELTTVQNAMLHAQHPFTYIDRETADREAGKGWKNFVITPCEISDALITTIRKLSAGGCRVIWYREAAWTTFADSEKRLPQEAMIVRSPEELLAVIRPDGAQLCAVDGKTEGILMRRSAHCVLLVNHSDETKKLFWKGRLDRILDPFADAAISMKNTDGGVRFELAGFSAALLYTE
ncbi:MAG: hypothetical protein E7463_05755 [Ruminococcaceae bacterium]|nr:hypothetical protein [Oscillospiraceae bacterium]